MYCSRRGIHVQKRTETCSRCGRCNWARQERNNGQADKGSIFPVLILAVMVLIAAGVYLLCWQPR